VHHVEPGARELKGVVLNAGCTQMNAALATVLLYKRKVSPMTETKPGKAPKNVDYIGLDPSRQHLLFYASSPDTLRDLKVGPVCLSKSNLHYTKAYHMPVRHVPGVCVPADSTCSCTEAWEHDYCR
jgi:hypothetical protein